MTKEYTEIIEDNYPVFMKEQWVDHVARLERDLRKARTKIAELEKKAEAQEELIRENVDSLHD